MPVAWGMPPGKRLQKSFIRLLCPRVGQKVQICVLGPVMGVQTHWTEKGTKLCNGHECIWHDTPQTWKGYMPVLAHNWCPPGHYVNGSFEWVLVLGEETGDEAQAWKRGDCFVIDRPGKKHNAPLRATPVTVPIKGDLREAFDVIPYVQRATGQLAVPNIKLRLRAAGLK